MDAAHLTRPASGRRRADSISLAAFFAAARGSQPAALQEEKGHQDRCCRARWGTYISAEGKARARWPPPHTRERASDRGDTYGDFRHATSTS